MDTGGTFVIAVTTAAAAGVLARVTFGGRLRPPPPHRKFTCPRPTTRQPRRDAPHAPPPVTAPARGLARTLFAAAVRSADAGAAVLAELERRPLPDRTHWLLAVGKAAPAMAAAATRVLRSARIPLVGGIVVAPAGSAAVRGLETAFGDHPTPGADSLRAAERVGVLLARVRRDDAVLVLVSGGASALIAAPVPGVSAEDLRALHDGLLRSGADIGTMNAIRRRVARWGAGRVATAVAPAPVRCLLVSDVAGDDAATIGSGPCAPDPVSAPELVALLARERLEGAVPAGIRRWIADSAAGHRAETPKPGDPAFARVETHVVLANRHAVRAAAAAAAALGVPATVEAEELRGDARDAGRRCAGRLLATADTAGVVVWGGETTVALPPDAPPGGRCQALALAAGVVLHEAGGRARGLALLAAGTDGRDGPTDAAGAIVDGATWARVARAGGDPAALLAAHASHAALALAGDLLRTGATGTNVRDVVVGVALR